MHTTATLVEDLRNIGVREGKTLFVHSSMKALGEVEGRADAVLDALQQIVTEKGLLALPTHTWNSIGQNRPYFDPDAEPACVGILPNLFRKREGVRRSLHPTHSVAAWGRDKDAFSQGEEYSQTPCAINGWAGKLMRSGGKILFLGATLRCNTFLHGVEEWLDIPDRLSSYFVHYFIRKPDGSWMDRYGRTHSSSVGDVSANYGKMEPLFLAEGAAVKGRIGDADCFLCDAAAMFALTSRCLKEKPQLFADDKPL